METGKAVTGCCEPLRVKTLHNCVVYFLFPDKKSAEAVTSLAKRRNVYTPSTLQINSRSSGSFSSPHHGPQTPTFQGLLKKSLFIVTL